MITRTQTRRIVGSAWLLLSVVALLFITNAHVTLAALASIAYAACLILVGWKDDRDGKWGSFAWGWATFYLLTASAFLVYVWISTGFFADRVLTPASGALWYHLFANVAFLGLFWFRMARTSWAVRGWWTAMVMSPVMFLIVWAGRSFLAPPHFIGGIFLIGLALGMVDVVFLRNRWEGFHATKIFRIASQIILWAFLITFLFLLGWGLSLTVLPK